MPINHKDVAELSQATPVLTRHMLGSLLALRCLAVASLFLWQQGDALAQAETGSALHAQLIDPEGQWLAIINLLHDSGFRDPAQALSRWKRADPARSLGKPIEALLASFNSDTAHSLRSLEQAALTLDLNRGRANAWHAIIPDESGTLSDLLTALAITEGRSGQPIHSPDPTPFDRIGAVGFPVMARIEDRLVVASNAHKLNRALSESTSMLKPSSMREAGGLIGRLVIGRLESDAPLNLKRLQAGLLALGVREVGWELGVVGSSFRAEFLGLTHGSTTIDRRWLKPIPDSADCVACVAIDPSPAAWAVRFEAADRVEKADPIASHRAPIRARLALLSRAAGIRLDRDVLPHVRGATLALTIDRMLKPLGIRLIIHAPDPQTAGRLRATLDKLRAMDAALAGLAGPLITAQDENVLIDWGISTRENAKPDAEEFQGRLDRVWAEGLPTRIAWVRPTLLADFSWLVLPENVLSAAEPILWHGRSTVNGNLDRVEWTGLDRLARLLAEHAKSP